LIAGGTNASVLACTAVDRVFCMGFASAGAVPTGRNTGSADGARNAGTDAYLSSLDQSELGGTELGGAKPRGACAAASI
jgi:hypothetical protein